MTAAAVLEGLDRAGIRLALRPDGGLSMRPAPPPELLAEARRYRDDIVHLITLRPAVANDPVSRCPFCGHNIWWRLSVLSGGPGPWQCGRCTPTDPDKWIDATVIPAQP
jgi:hypothetical protein